MALTNRRRSALAEIPIQLSLLRVSAEEPPLNVLPRTFIDSPLDNIPIGYLTPSPSQDELIIRQRGRRRIAINWSPEKPITSPSTSSPMRTPTKATTTMTLRSSPRKRLYAGTADGPAPPSPLSKEKNHTGSPYRVNGMARTPGTPSPPYSPQSKRSRITSPPIAQSNDKTPLAKLLKGFSSAQLINIIQGLTNNDPTLEQKIRANLMMPDIRPMEEQLIVLKKNIFKSMPTSRLMKSTDSVSHSRVATHLTQFKKAIVDHSRLLNDSENWDSLFDYCMLAWNYVKATPVWENNSQNAIRRSCFKILAYHCLSAIKSAGQLLGQQRLNEIYANVNGMKSDCEDISLCIVYLDRMHEKMQGTPTSSTK